MRKLLVAGVLVSGALLACETKTPSGPAELTATTSVATTTTSAPPPPTTTPTSSSSSTTTSFVPSSLAASFKTFPPGPANQPSEVTVFLKLLTVLSVASPLERVMTSLGIGEAAAVTELEYSVTGVYVMPNGTTGTINGELGGSINPLETGGEFEGSLTARTAGPSSCTGQRDFGGTMSVQSLNWVGQAPGPDQGPAPCASNPLMAFNSMNMLRSDPSAPLPTPPPTSTTTSVTSTTTTSVTCTYSLTPSSDPSVPASGGTRSVAINTQAGCGWSAQSSASWVTINPPFGGTGPATVTYNVQANSTSTTRSTTLTIAGLPFAVTQSGAMPDLDLEPDVPTCTAPPAGASGTWTVTMTVRNIGPVGAPGSFTGFLFGDPSEPTVERVATSALGPGASQTHTVNVDSGCWVTAGANQTCRVEVRADYETTIAESNEANNIGVGTCTRPTPPCCGVRPSGVN
jgi:hypothetical protein